MGYMAPENAFIGHFEDDEENAADTNEYLEDQGNKVVSKAASLDKAMKQIPTFKKKGVQVAIVDGNLGEGPENEDGETLVKAIHDKYPDMIVIGNAMDSPIRGANKNVTKEMGLDALVDAVRKA